MEPIPDAGHLIGIAASGRLALESTRSSGLADALDMDFGGRRTLVVYDPSTRAVCFRETSGAKGGAPLSPDGLHVAIVDGGSLFIYSLP